MLDRLLPGSLLNRPGSGGLVCLLLLAALFAARGSGEPAKPNRPPNLLFAIADDWGYPHAGVYGCGWVTTPAFDRVARGGVLFNRAYTPNAKCAPSRAVLLTGRNSWQLEAAANHWCVFPPKFRTYPEALAEHSYFAGTTGKGWGPGVARDAQGNPRRMTGQPFGRRTAPPPARAAGNNDYAANFEDFLAAAPRDRPWCFWYGGTEPHRAYEYGVGARTGKKTSDIDRVPGYLPDNEVIRNDLLDYAFEVEHFDRHLGRMLDLLEKRGELDNILVVVTGDHGIPFPRAKGQAYEASNHIPLAMMWRAGIRNPGRAVEDYVSFADVAPTFVELARLKWEQTAMAPAAGRSLAGILRSDRTGRRPEGTPRRDHVLLGKERHDIGRPRDAGYPIRGIVKDGMLYLRNFEASRWPAGNPETGYLNCDGSPAKTEVLNARRTKGKDPHWDLCFGKRPEEELYDLRKDPDCVTNLAALPKRRKLKERLREQAFAELKREGDPRMSGRGNVFDEYPYADEAGRNFYERFMRGERPRAGWVNESDFEKAPLD